MCFLFLLEGLRVRWPKGPPHLALSPPYFVVVSVVFLFCFGCFFVLFFVFWGYESQLSWPKGPPHLALNPPYFFFRYLFFAFLSKKDIVVYFRCLPLFLLSLCFGLTLRHFLFLCHSLVVFFFLLFCFSCKCLVLASCFCFVCFLFQDVVLFFCSACFLVLFWIILLDLFLLCILFSCCCCCCCCLFLLFWSFWFFWFLATYQKHLSAKMILQKTWKCRKTGHFDKSK